MSGALPRGGHDLRIRKGREGYTVSYTGDWAVLAGPYATKEAAEAARDRMTVQANTSRRLCMCCAKPFTSSGIGHRLCDVCKRNDGILMW
jgi:hypothetical protein